MDWLSFFWGFEVTVVLGGLGALLFGVIGDGLLMTPKQRGAGQTGNTSWGHRSNRVTSHKRGGDSHRGGGGTGKKPPTKGICGLIVFGSAAFILTGLGAGFAQII